MRIKKLILFEEFFENVFKSRTSVSFNPRYTGALTYVGTHYEEDVFTFRPSSETGEISTSEKLKLKEGDICDVVD
jgi:hypothetical protein